MGRWYILDPGLANDKGHHLSQAQSIARELRHRGTTVAIYGFRDAKRDLLGDLEVNPWFRGYTYAAMSADPLTGEYEDYIHFNRLLAEDLQKLPLPDFTEGDTVLFPTVSHNQFHAIIQWASDLDAKRQPRIVSVLMFPPDWATVARAVSEPARYYRAAWESLPPQIGSQLHVCAETLAVAKAFATLFGKRPTVLPRLVDDAASAPRETADRIIGRRTNAPILSYLGHARAERGFQLLPELVDLTVRSGAAHRYFVQSYHDNQPLMRDVEARLSQSAHVTVHPGALDRADYWAVLKNSDFVLLPYRADRYQARGSGIYFEAAWAGVPVIVPAKTWMSREIEETGAGVIFDAFDPRSIAKAVLAALSRQPELHKPVQRSASRLRQMHGVRQFVDRIEQL